MTWKKITEQTVIRGTPLRSQEGTLPNKDYGRGRICAHEGCSTILSRYNSGNVCAAHEKDNN